MNIGRTLNNFSLKINELNGCKIQIKLIRHTISFLVNKHKPWIETSYHGIITENNDTVILDPPLVALDKDAPVPFAGRNIH